MLTSAGKRLIAAALGAVVSILLCAPLSLAQTSPSAFTTGYRYDLGGRVTGVISPDPDGAGALRYAAVRNTYNAQGMLVTVETGELSAWQADTIAPASWTGFTVFRTETRTYDDWGRPTRTNQTAGGTTYTVTQMSYDVHGRLDCAAVRMNSAAFGALPASACTLGTEGTQGKDRITRNEYDALNRVTRVMRAYGTPLQQDYARYEYDAGGNQSAVTDANGNRTERDFDGFGRLSRIEFPSPTTTGQVNAADFESYQYDPNGNRTQLRKRDGQLINYSYDALNRVTVQDVGGVATAEDVFYGYDLRNLRTFARFASTAGEGVTEQYDGFGRRTSATTNVGGTARTLTHTYDADGNRTRVDYPGAVYFTYEYDGLDRMTRTLENGATELVRIAYDTQGRRSALTRANGAAASTTYSYDPISRPSTLAHDLSGTGSDISFAFTYNTASQAISRAITSNNAAYSFAPTTLSPISYARNGLNQYTSVSGTAFGYDPNGSLTSDGATTFGYDVGNRLRTATGARNATLSYDPLGRLHQIVSGGVTTRFLHDGDALVAEYDASGTVLRRYVHGSGVDEPWVWYEGASVASAARRFLHPDHQGSIVSVSDNAGALIGANAYDPYGVPAASNLGRFQYTGQIWLPELALYHYKARAYSATLGRFLQTDPVGYADDLNWYAYVGNDPFNLRDPTGREVFTGCRWGNHSAGFECPMSLSPQPKQLAPRPAPEIPSAPSPSPANDNASPPANDNSPRPRFSLRAFVRAWILAESLKAIGRNAANGEITVYRVCDNVRAMCRSGRSWTPEDPRGVANWRDRYAVYPAWNSGTRLATGTVTFNDLFDGNVQPTGNPGSIAGPQPYRPDLGGGPYAGNGVEWRIPNAPLTVDDYAEQPFAPQ